MNGSKHEIIWFISFLPQGQDNFVQIATETTQFLVFFITNMLKIEGPAKEINVIRVI